MTKARKLWCPVCDQGWVVEATIRRDGDRIWVCEECEVLWIGPTVSRYPDDTFSSLMEERGYKPLWDELEFPASGDEK